jgi:hypothetical protein
MSAHPRRRKTLHLGYNLSGQELGEKYDALDPYGKGYVAGVIAAFTSLRDGPPAA